MCGFGTIHINPQEVVSINEVLLSADVIRSENNFMEMNPSKKFKIMFYTPSLNYVFIFQVFFQIFLK